MREMNRGEPNLSAAKQPAEAKRLRGFENAKGWEKYNLELPKRATGRSAAYDIAAAENVTVPIWRPGTPPTIIPTGLKVYMQPDEVLILANRSSGAGKGMVMANGIGIIDADYYNNPHNDGHFQIIVFNCTDHEIVVKKGDRIAQAVFQKFLTIDGDSASGRRLGGIGSTDQTKEGNISVA